MRADQLIVQVRDKTLARKGTIRPRDLNLAAVVRYCDVGEWSLTLPKAHPMVAVLQEPGSGIVVSYNASTAFLIPAATLFSGPTEKPGRLTNRENPDGTYTFKGLTDDVILRDARAFPEPSNPDPSTQNVANDTRTGVAETVMHAYVSANIGPTAHASRRGLLAQELTLATDLGRGPSVTRSPRFENLLSLLQGIALYAGLGFRVVQSGSALVFEVRSIVDRTAEVRLDIASGTLASEQVETAPPTVTRAIVAGQGEGTDRLIVQRTSADSTAAEAAWGRIIEEWMDARGSADPDEVEQKGDEALLAGGATTTAVKLTPSDDQTMLFMRDWEVGDRIAVILPSSGGAAPFTPVVTAAAIVAGAGRAALGMSIGDTSQMSDKSATVSKVASTTQRVEDLEQSERALPAVLTTDPGADRFVFWDDSAGALAFLEFTSALVITGTSLDVAQATDILAGKVELATSAETITGTDATRAVTPAGLALLTATDLRRGLVELATAAEVAALTDPDRAVTPLGLAATVGRITSLEARESLVRVVPSSMVVSSGSGSYDSNGKVTFTTAGGVSLRDIFTAAFTNYLVFVNVDSASGGSGLFVRLAPTTTDDTTGYSGSYSEHSGAAAWANTALTTELRPFRVGPNGAGGWFRVFTPFSASTRSRIVGEGHDSDGYHGLGGGQHSTAKQHKQLTVYLSGVTMTGTMEVYGVRG